MLTPKLTPNEANLQGQHHDPLLAPLSLLPYAKSHHPNRQLSATTFIANITPTITIHKTIAIYTITNTRHITTSSLVLLTTPPSTKQVKQLLTMYHYKRIMKWTRLFKSNFVFLLGKV